MVNAKLGLDISEYLKQEIKVSSLALSNYLIESQGYSNNLFSTGRPKVYVNVVSYLEKLEMQGVIKSINKNVTDCSYELLYDKLDEVDSENKSYNDNNNLDSKIDNQLSLF